MINKKSPSILLLLLFIFVSPVMSQDLTQLLSQTLPPNDIYKTQSFSLSQEHNSSRINRNSETNNTETKDIQLSPIETSYNKRRTVKPTTYTTLMDQIRNKTSDTDSLDKKNNISPSFTKDIPPSLLSETSNPQDVTQNMISEVVENTENFEQLNQNNVPTQNILKHPPKTKTQEKKRSKKTLTDKDRPILQYGYNSFNNDIRSINLSSVPLPDTYILKPGDQLSLRVWGKLDNNFILKIEKDGYIYIPKVGRIFLDNFSLKDAKKEITAAINATFVNVECSVSVYSSRTINVFILGHVKNPGLYTMPAYSPLFSALYECGGPTKLGSLRNIQIKRNNKTYSTIDAYDTFMHGTKNIDETIENYDTIFIPPIGDTVMIEGEIKQAGIYEISSDTTLYTVINTMGGGIQSSGLKKHIQIERIDSNDQLTLIDFHPEESKNFDTLLKNTPVRDGDRISIFPINISEQNSVRIEGNVHRPGNYTISETTTLASLVKKANGLKGESYSQGIEIYRYISDTQRKVFFKDLSLPSDKDFLLESKDIVKVLTNEDATGRDTVFIFGAVKEPGEYKRLKDMRVSDLIFLAKLEDGAFTSRAELIRSTPTGKTTLLNIDIHTLIKEVDSPKNIQLQKNDRVYIRYSDKTNTLKEVTLSGEFTYPGKYIALKDEPLSSIIERAGGFTKNAFPKGTFFYRKSSQMEESKGNKKILNNEQKKLVYDQSKLTLASKENHYIFTQAIQFLEKQVENSKGRILIKISDTESLRGSPYDIIIEDKDFIHVPSIPATIQIVGGVKQPTSIIFEERKSPSYYVNIAGGYSEFGNKKEFHVYKSDGSIEINPKHVERGDTIYVPEKIKLAQNNIEIISKIIQTITNVLSSLYISGIISK